MQVSVRKIPVLYFHSIRPKKDPGWIKNYLTLELEVFELILNYLKQNKWQTLFLSEYHDIRKNNERPKGRYCCLTFDDGYLDNYAFVYPLLSKYGLKATIFVSPECINDTQAVSLNLFHVWNKQTDMDSISKSAYLSWPELKEMQQSGCIDIQSHTMTHSKYISSGRIIDFHHPGDRCFHQIMNRYPMHRKSYFDMPDFEQLIPYGTPVFEERSSVVTRIHEINGDFLREAGEALKGNVAGQKYDFNRFHMLIKPVYERYISKNNLIIYKEDDAHYSSRVLHEISGSKKRIEKELGKQVDFLCWPHGENNESVHQLAMESGYRATTVGKSGADPDAVDRIDRFGIRNYGIRMLTRMGIRYKLNSYVHKFPEYQVYQLRKLLSG